MKKESKVEAPISSKQTYFLIGLGIFYFALTLAFLYMLNNIYKTGFGWREWVFALGIACFITLFLTWVTSTIRKDVYFGVVVGITFIALSVYSLFIRYSGMYTTIFAVAGGVVALIYILYTFFQFKQSR